MSSEVKLAQLKGSGRHMLRKLETEGLAEWRVARLVSKSTVHTLEFDGSKYSNLAIEIHIDRRAGFYIWKIAAPFTLIVVMSFSVYFMEPGEIGDRVGTAIEAALTATAFQVCVNDTLPKVGYMTYLDYFIMTAFVTICLACAESVVAFQLSKQGVSDAEIEYYDIAAFRISLSVLLSALLIFVTRANK